MPRTQEEFVNEVLGLEKVLRAYLHRFAPQPAGLDDLIQETYSHLFQLNPARRVEIRSVQAFAITSARNVAVSRMRHQQVVPIESVEDLDLLPMDEDSPQLDDIVHSHQQIVRIAEGLATLPERCRVIFTLCRVYGFSQKEIARRLHISEGVVEQQLIKGMRRCAKVLSEPPRKRREVPERRSGWVPQWLRRKGSGFDE